MLLSRRSSSVKFLKDRSTFLKPLLDYLLANRPPISTLSPSFYRSLAIGRVR